MICSKCGKSIEDNSVFCKVCGAQTNKKTKYKKPKHEVIVLSSTQNSEIKLMVIHNRMKPAWGTAEFLSGVKDDPCVVYNGVIKDETVYLEDEKTKDKCDISIRVVDDLFIVKYRINSDEKTKSVRIGEGFSYRVPVLDAMESWDFIIYPDIFDIMPDFENICRLFSQVKYIAKAYYDKRLMYRIENEDVFFEVISEHHIPKNDEMKQKYIEFCCKNSGCEHLSQDLIENCVGKNYHIVEEIRAQIIGDDGLRRCREDKIISGTFSIIENEATDKVRLLKYLFELLNIKKELDWMDQMADDFRERDEDGSLISGNGGKFKVPTKPEEGYENKKITDRQITKKYSKCCISSLVFGVLSLLLCFFNNLLLCTGVIAMATGLIGNMIIDRTKQRGRTFTVLGMMLTLVACIIHALLQ